MFDEADVNKPLCRDIRRDYITRNDVQYAISPGNEISGIFWQCVRPVQKIEIEIIKMELAKRLTTGGLDIFRAKVLTPQF
jgi:hypothetical protein